MRKMVKIKFAPFREQGLCNRRFSRPNDRPICTTGFLLDQASARRRRPPAKELGNLQLPFCRHGDIEGKVENAAGGTP